MPRMICLLGIAGLGCFLGLQTPLPAHSAAPSPSIDQWIAMLGSRDFQDREEASQALITRGPIILPSLRKAQANLDPEVQRRVDELILSLEKTNALTPRRVSLHLANKPIRDAIASLIEQTGYKILLQEDSDRDKQLFSFDMDNLTFWETLDRVCEAGTLFIQNNDDVIQLLYQDTFVPYVHRTGSFRFVATGFQYSRTIDFSQVPRSLADPGQRSEALCFSFTIAGEPRVPLLYVGNPRLTAAYDDLKYSMLPEPQINNEVVGRYGNGYKKYNGAGNVNLVRPSQKSRVARLIKGLIPVTLLAEERPEIVVSDILHSKGKKFQVDTTTLNIQDVTEDTTSGKVYKIPLSISEAHKKDETDDDGWANSLNQRFDLLDARGTPYPRQGINWENHSGMTAEGTLVFGDDSGQLKLGPPVKLVFNTWITVHHEIPFEFKDLPLP